MCVGSELWTRCLVFWFVLWFLEHPELHLGENSRQARQGTSPSVHRIRADAIAVAAVQCPDRWMSDRWIGDHALAIHVTHIIASGILCGMIGSIASSFAETQSGMVPCSTAPSKPVTCNNHRQVCSDMYSLKRKGDRLRRFVPLAP